MRIGAKDFVAIFPARWRGRRRKMAAQVRLSLVFLSVTRFQNRVDLVSMFNRCFVIFSRFDCISFRFESFSLLDEDRSEGFCCNFSREMARSSPQNGGARAALEPRAPLITLLL